MTRYERLADEVADMIHQGALQVGDRLPSVRESSVRSGVSASTVFAAYYLLESRGLVEARARSGYYVRAQALLAPPEPETPAASAPSASIGVNVSDLVFSILEATRDRALVPLGSAFPDVELFPLDRLARCLASGMRRLDPAVIVESLPPGNDRLRRHIARRCAIGGFPVELDEIVITSGALEGLNLALETVTRPGDGVAVESPTFYAALQALERLGLQAVEIPTHPREGIDLNALALALDRHPIRACWLMPTFQNPLGSLMSDERKSALVALLAGRGVPLIEDDVYGDLHFAAQRPPPAKAFDRTGQVLHCGSFSKSLAPGYRVGWVAAGRHAPALLRRKISTSLAVATPSQEALAEYLEGAGYDRHLRRLRLTLQQLQACALESIATHFPVGTKVARPQGGYFVWVEMPNGVDALLLHRQALAEGIGLAPGPMFSAAQGFRHCLRINYAHPDRVRMQAALHTVGRLASALLASSAHPGGPDACG